MSPHWFCLYYLNIITEAERELPVQLEIWLHFQGAVKLSVSIYSTDTQPHSVSEFLAQVETNKHTNKHTNKQTNRHTNKPLGEGDNCSCVLNDDDV